PWAKETKDEFQHDLCLAFISSGIAWNVISDVQLRHFLAKWIPGAEIPDHRKLAGPILDKEVTRVISKTRLHTAGRFATGQSDGWKNIAKASVVTSMIIVDFEYAEQEYQVMIIAWCTDAAGDAKKMWKDLIKQMPWLISLDCSAHQINLVVGDLFKLKSGYLTTIDKTTEVIKWFNNHSRALGLLRKEQLATYHKILALIQPVITRWTCHFLSTQCLLETSSALRSCCIKDKKLLEICGGDRQQEKARAHEIIKTVLDQNFWSDI
ncbi:hypothetical protein SCLCIDRAFT_78472, partial [Scleroderma citrinum Foug A]